MAILTITIPKKSAGAQELVAIPRKEYEELLRSKKQQQEATIIVRRLPLFRVPKKHEAFYDALDKELTEALRNHRAGNSYGPFETVKEGISFLKSYKARQFPKTHAT